MEHRLAAAGLASHPWLRPPGDGTVTGRAPQRTEVASPGPTPLPRAGVVQEEVAFANALAEFLHHKVTCTYDERMHQIVVTVTHEESKAVIRHFPSEEMIQLMITLRRDFRGFIFNCTA